MPTVSRTSAVLLAALALTTACSVQQTEIPGLTGPSDFALSIQVSATPDVINQDGSSQSSVIVTVNGPDGRPVSSVPVRLDLLVGGTYVDFGSLSAKNVVTGGDGRATAVYTAPGAPPANSSPFQVVTVSATPVGSNYEAGSIATADIRLNAPGVILPPAGTPTASFTFSPGAPSIGTEVFFDASASLPGSGASAIVNYQWSFGDGNTGAGPLPQIDHVYDLAGQYTVTLTVTNDRSVSAQTTRTITVSAGAEPTADFVFSPTAPAVGQMVQFDASLSKAAPGRAIVSWSWNFGDGSTASGPQVAKTYTTPATYNVVLVVTDNIGQQTAVSKPVTVGSGNPTASFTMSPQPPVTTVTVITFDASASTAAPGATIASYTWSFGDGTGSGPNASPTVDKGPATTAGAYPGPGTYSVTLTVTDSLGRSGITSQTVKVE